MILDRSPTCVERISFRTVLYILFHPFVRKTVDILWDPNSMSAKEQDSPTL